MPFQLLATNCVGLYCWSREGLRDPCLVVMTKRLLHYVLPFPDFQLYLALNVPRLFPD